ncbi:MAG: HEAT repeat domain-containing protein [Anaerolineales bacterium]
MTDPLLQVIAGLAGDGALTRAALAPLSGLERGAAARIAELLNTLPAERQREIVESLVGEAERSFDLDFGLVYRALLKHTDATIRRLCIEGLVEDVHLDLVNILIRLLENDPDISVRAAAADSLGRFVYAGEIDEIPAGHARSVRQALERTFQQLSTTPEVARRALESLAYINDDAIKAMIDRAYSADASVVRQSAVFAMGRSADTYWADIVLAELYSDDPAMRYEAARACGELQLDEAVEPLERMISERDAEVRYMAVQALGEIGTPEARKALERHSETDDPDLAEAIEEALAESSLADMTFEMLEVNPLDTDFVPDEPDAQETEEDVDADQEAFRDEFFEYTDEDEDDDWPDEFLSLD